MMYWPGGLMVRRQFSVSTITLEIAGSSPVSVTFFALFGSFPSFRYYCKSLW